MKPHKKKKDKPKKTVGQQYVEECYKEPPTRDPIELQRAMQEQYIDNLKECVTKSRKEWPHKDFFVVVITKNERLMDKIFRLYYLARQSCPTPAYDQSVYHYKHKEENLEFLWCVPDQNTVFHITHDKYFIPSPDQYDLVKMCSSFVRGDLLTLAQQLNKEINQ